MPEKIGPESPRNGIARNDAKYAWVDSAPALSS